MYEGQSPKGADNNERTPKKEREVEWQSTRLMGMKRERRFFFRFVVVRFGYLFTKAAPSTLGIASSSLTDAAAGKSERQKMLRSGHPLPRLSHPRHHHQALSFDFGTSSHPCLLFLSCPHHVPGLLLGLPAPRELPGLPELPELQGLPRSPRMVSKVQTSASPAAYCCYHSSY